MVVNVVVMGVGVVTSVALDVGIILCCMKEIGVWPSGVRVVGLVVAVVVGFAGGVLLVELAVVVVVVSGAGFGAVAGLAPLPFLPEYGDG